MIRKDIFGNELKPGDFVIGSTSKSISEVFYGVYTEHDTLCHYLGNDDELSYLNMKEVIPHKSYHCYKYDSESLDEKERALYDFYHSLYLRRMNDIEYYKNNLNNLPIGSLIQNRFKYETYLYLGHRVKHFTLTNDNTLFMNIMYNNQPLLYYISNYDVVNLLNHNLSIKECIKKDYSFHLTYYYKLSKNYYYLDKLDITGLYDTSGIEEYQDLIVHSNYKDFNSMLLKDFINFNSDMIVILIQGKVGNHFYILEK